MENEGSSRPVISFPLGLALLIIVLICISGLFTCCYNWNKLRNLLRPSSPPEDSNSNHSDSTHPCSDTVKPEEKHNERLTVVMPGDETPKFLAFPAPLG